MKHFIKETDFSTSELPDLFALAHDMKQRQEKHPDRPLQNQSWGLLFFKHSTRTRVSFEVGINELGGNSIILTAKDMQLGRGESIADTAKVLSRYLHGIVVRCFEHEVVEAFQEHGTVPIVNALTDFLHPCQIYSDMFTLAERWSDGTPSPDALKGRKIVFLGDTACNMANSWIAGAALSDMQITLSGPSEYAPGENIKNFLNTEGLPLQYEFTTDPIEAVSNADVIYTDVWVSMGQEADEIQRIPKMKPYAVTTELLEAAAPDACFMHCLPAHPGLEVTQEALDSPQSIIFDQAENRLHMQKAILAKIAEARC